MPTKIGELREKLVKAIDAALSGKIAAPEALAIAKLGTAAASLLQAEINAVKELRALGLMAKLPAVGDMTIGAAIEGEATVEDDDQPIIKPIERSLISQETARVVKGSRY